MENSHIEWTDHTFNPWIGCTKVSPGCAHCYAEARDIRFTGGIHWGKGAPRQRTSESNWNEPRRWNRIYAESLKAWCDGVGVLDQKPRRPRVFSASLADWLDDEVDVVWFLDFLDLVRQCDNLNWLLLTKRPQNWSQRMTAAYVESFARHEAELSNWIRNWIDGSAPDNIWLGTTVENQAMADERIPKLTNIPAKIRFLSCEPLLGPVDLQYPESLFPGGPAHCCSGAECGCQGQPIDPPLIYGINWVIAGGESGKEARPMHPDWARGIRLDCEGNHVPFLFKQWGEWVGADRHRPGQDRGTISAADKTPEYWPVSETAKQHDFKDGGFAFRVGKKEAGRLLDGVEHSEFPA